VPEATGNRRSLPNLVTNLRAGAGMSDTQKSSVKLSEVLRFVKITSERRQMVYATAQFSTDTVDNSVEESGLKAQMREVL
jgi:hypothetical protein